MSGTHDAVDGDLRIDRPAPSAPVVPPVARPLRYSTLPTAVRYALTLAALLAIWQAYVTFSHVSPLLVVAPAAVLQAVWKDVVAGQIPGATVITLRTLLIGIGFGATLGFVFASFAVFSIVGRDVLAVLTAVLNPLPAIAILPLAMIWFGLTPTSIVFVVALATIWPVAINVDAGFRTISPTLQMVARNLGLGGPRLVLDVLIPAAMPHLLTGLKTAWAFGWRTVVAAELVFGAAGSAGGLGWYINNARYYLLTAQIFGGLLVISVLGILVESLFGIVERRTVVKWGMSRAK
ncbi:MAG: ABC transporter permease [Vulcanimicrobiaceae bacterium]